MTQWPCISIATTAANGSRYLEEQLVIAGDVSTKRDLVLGVLMAPLVRRLRLRPDVVDDRARRRGRISRLARDHAIVGMAA